MSAVMAKQVFISHASQDAGFAHRLANDLHRKGFAPWIAPESIPPGELWVLAIQRGLDESNAYVVAMSPAAVSSRWVQIEAGIAIQNAIQSGRLFIPLDFQPCQAPSFWRAHQTVSFQISYDAGLRELLARLESFTTPPPPPPPPIPLFPQSPATTQETIARRGAKPSPASPTSSVMSIVQSLMRDAINAPPLTGINSDATLYKFAHAQNLGNPQTAEFVFAEGTNDYIGQVFARGIAYVKRGDWSNVEWVAKT